MKFINKDKGDFEKVKLLKLHKQTQNQKILDLQREILNLKNELANQNKKIEKIYEILNKKRKR